MDNSQSDNFIYPLVISPQEDPPDRDRAAHNLYQDFEGGYLEIEPWCDGSINACVMIMKEEIPADYRERRRLVAATLQPLGDALLAAMEKMVVEQDK